MGVGPLNSIDEVAEGNEVMEKRERQDGITTEQAKGRTLRWQPLLPNLRRVNEADDPSASGPSRRAYCGTAARWDLWGQKPAMAELPDKLSSPVRWAGEPCSL